MSTPRTYGLRFVKGGTVQPGDKRFGIANPTIVLPDSFSLQSEMPPVWNQLNTSSCTAHAAGAAFEHRLKHMGIEFTPSRLFLYYNERLLEGDTSQDNGATIRDSMVALQNWGDLNESQWPFQTDNMFKQPPPDVYQQASKNKVITFQAVPQDELSLKHAIFAHNPVCFGINVYRSFESQKVAKSGRVPVPDPKSEQYLGGHAIILVGWRPGSFLFRNSWGEGWGNGGYAWIPNEYVLNPELASEFWIITAQN